MALTFVQPELLRLTQVALMFLCILAQKRGGPALPDRLHGTQGFTISRMAGLSSRGGRKGEILFRGEGEGGGNDVNLAPLRHAFYSIQSFTHLHHPYIGHQVLLNAA